MKLARQSDRFPPHSEFVAQEGSLKVIVILMVGLCFAANLQGRGHKPVMANVTPPDDQNPKSPQAPVERLIHALSGEWSGEEIYDPSDLVPAGGKGHSLESYRAGPARMSLVQEYHGDGVAGKSWGTGIIWWEAQDQGFRFVWCDTYALDRGCRVSSQVGKWDGDDFVLTNMREVSGKPLLEREVWSSFTPNSFIQTLYVGAAPDRLKRFMTLTARRLKHRE